MKKLSIILLLLLSISLLLTACADKPKGPAPKTATHVNVKKYMGTWYDIASLKTHGPQTGCRCTTTRYIWHTKYIRVVNSCYRGKDNKLTRVSGRAWVSPKSNNSKLVDQFFWPLKGDYWILYVDKNYQHAVVGTPNRKYLWILSRTRQVNSATLKKLKAIAKRQGYALNQLQLTQQTNCNN